MNIQVGSKKQFFLIAIILLLIVTSPVWVVFIQENSGGLIISEFVAANGTGLVDEDGDTSDWIEIHNRSPWPVNLSGWSLTDNSEQPEKWTFPDMILGSDEYIVIFASGKNRKPVEPDKELHTNFRLNKQAEFLGLYNILDGKFIDKVVLPRQFSNVAYGRYGDDLAYGYLLNPTPGEANDETSACPDVGSEVQFSVKRGFFDTPFTLELTTVTPDATIHYTTDGSIPTDSHGIVYDQPIFINSTTLIRATAFTSNTLPFYVDTHTYIFLEDVLSQPPAPPGFPMTWGLSSEDLGGYHTGEPVKADYEMDPEVVNDPRYKHTIKDDLKSIPSMSIVTDIQSFTDLYSNPMERGKNWERPASVELIDPADPQKNFQINAGLRIQGNAGRREFVPKHSFRLFFRGEYGATKLEYPLFPDSPLEEFETIILRGGVSRSYGGHPNEWRENRLATYTRDEWLRTSQIAMSELSAHGTFVHLYLNGLYWGLYNIVERPDAAFTAAYLGGREKDWYVINQAGLVEEADDQIEDLFRSFRSSRPQDKYTAVAPYIDSVQFSDYIILNWYVGTQDWPHNNWYASIENPPGELRFFTWDGERTWIKGARIRLGQTNPALWPNIIRPIFETLLQNPDFKIQFADRMYKHLYNDGALTDANSQARWLRLNNIIDRAIVGESARWGDTWEETALTHEDWLRARDNVLAQMKGNAARLIVMAREAGYYPPLDPPDFSQPGGSVKPGSILTMSTLNGTIYYTTDGSDPRMPGTGEIAPHARLYSSSVVLTDTVQIKARTLIDGSSPNSEKIWSALHEATFRVVDLAQQLQFSEIMYNPVGGGAYEFLEIKNSGSNSINLSNISIEGIRFTFPPNTPPLLAGESVVLVRDRAAFAQRYPKVKIGGVYGGQLSNGGEHLALVDVQGNILISVEYDDENGWPISPDSRGDSLMLIDPYGDPNDPNNWRASIHPYGSPGTDEP